MRRVAMAILILLALGASAWAEEANAPWSNFYVSHGPSVVNWPGGYSQERDPNGNPIFAPGNVATDAGGGIIYNRDGTGWPKCHVGDVICFNDANSDRKLTRIVALNGDFGYGADPNCIQVSPVVPPNMVSTHCNVGGDFGSVAQWSIMFIVTGNAAPMQESNRPVAVNVPIGTIYNESFTLTSWPAGTATNPVLFRGYDPNGTGGDLDPWTTLAQATIRPDSNMPVETITADPAGAIVGFKYPHHMGVGQKLRFAGIAGNGWAVELNTKDYTVLKILDANRFTISDGNTSLGTYTQSTGIATAFDSGRTDMVQGTRAYTTLDNLAFYGVVTGNGVDAFTSSNITLRNVTCDVSGSAKPCFEIGGSSSTGVTLIRCGAKNSSTLPGFDMRSSGTNCRLIDCFATACRDGAAVSTAACIRNCRFVGNTRHGVVIVGIGTNMEFVGNTIADNGISGIDWGTISLTGSIVSDNIISNNGITLTATFGADGNSLTFTNAGSQYPGTGEIYPVVFHVGGVADPNAVPVPLTSGYIYFLKFANATSGKLWSTYAANTGPIQWNATNNTASNMHLGFGISGVHTSPQQRLSVFGYNSIYGNSAGAIQGNGGLSYAIYGTTVIPDESRHNDYTSPPFLGTTAAARNANFYATAADMHSRRRPLVDGNYIAWRPIGDDPNSNYPADSSVTSGVVYGSAWQFTGSAAGGGAGDPNFTSWRIGGLLPVPDANRLFKDYSLDGITGLFATTTAGNILGGVTIGGGTLAVAGSFNEATRNTDPGIGNVLSGTGYKIGNVSLTGSYVPAGFDPNLYTMADLDKLLTDGNFVYNGTNHTGHYVAITQATALTTAAYGVGSGTHGTYTPFLDGNFALNIAPAWAVSAGLTGLYTPFRDANFAITTAPKWGDANAQGGAFNLTTYENGRNTTPGTSHVAKDSNWMYRGANQVGTLDANVASGGPPGPPMEMGFGLGSVLCAVAATWCFRRQIRR